MSNISERRAEPGELCTCGRQAIVVYLGGAFGPTGDCGIRDDGDRTGPCPFCGGPRHSEIAGRCPQYRLRLQPEQAELPMPGRISPEPSPPDDDPERLAEERELVRSARLAGLAVQRAADLGRLLGGKPDGYTLDQLDHLASTPGGWAIRMAFGTGDTDLLAELTGRPWTAIEGLDDVMRLWRQQHPDTPEGE